MHDVMLRQESDLSHLLGVNKAPHIKAEEFSLGPWKLIKVNHGLTMEAGEQQELGERLAEWVDVFPRNPSNLIQREEGVPSTLIRFDYTQTPGIGPQIYEVEERPAGIGITLTLNSKFRDGLVRSVEFWQQRFDRSLAICVSNERDGTSDDAIWAVALLREPIAIFTGVPDPKLVDRYIWWPRVTRTECDYFHLTPHSLSTIELEGNKRYGVEMGLWHPIRRPADIPLRTGCALKPAAGSRAEDIKLVGGKAREGSGFISVSRALREIEKGMFAYWQPLHEAERADRHSWLRPDYHLIRRVYFAYCATATSSARYRCLGGCWMATPNARVHGTTQTLTGPIYPNKIEWL